ncbi:hypothetical protein BU17DRAFT_43062 [Hysterangium stoloniferum]|nr:hypothetical protein BU17DRAFT_43062 [Hysterangium stoloniferum]
MASLEGGCLYDVDEESSLQPDKPFRVSDAELLASPIALPCGRVISNRLVKVAMYEHLAAFSGGSPNQYHISLYSRWAQGGWGMIITGNCQISPTHLTLGRDITIPRAKSVRELDPFKALSTAMRSSGIPYAKDGDSPLAIMQLSHTGGQSPRFIGGRLGTLRRPVAPSSRRFSVDSKGNWLTQAAYWFLFSTPRTLTSEQVRLLVEDFFSAAKLAYETGFDGVQLHAAHGCRLDSSNQTSFRNFYRPRRADLNNRQDEYSNRLLLLQQIILRIKAEMPPRFVLGVKLNAGDYVTGGLSEEDALNDTRRVSQLGIDFIEISGGNYENPVYANASPRQAFFASFSRKVVQSMPISGTKSTPLIILTGGLRTPSQMARIISHKHAHLLGLGRLSVLCPDFPHRISPVVVVRGDEDALLPIPEPNLYCPRWFPKLVGAGVGTAWYVVAMRQIARGKDINSRMGSIGAVFWMWIWAGPYGLAGFAIWTLIGLVFVLTWVRLSGWS